MGPAVRLRYLTGLRHGWRAWLVLALLTGVAGGLALTAVTDARRTWSALPRALASANAADIQVSGGTDNLDPVRAAAFAEKVGRLPGVRALDAIAGVYMGRVLPDGTLDPALQTGHALGFVDRDQDDAPLNQARLLEGRLAAPDRANEVVVNPQMADAAGWSVGDHVTDLRAFPATALDDDGVPVSSEGLPLTLDVVGLVEPVDDVLAGDDAIARTFLTPAFEAQFSDPVFAYLFENIALEGGAAGLPAFRAELDELTTSVGGPQTAVTSLHDGLNDVRDGLRPQVVAIWLLGLVLLAATVLLAGQAISRQVQSHEPDLPELRALGMTRGQRSLLGLLHGLTVAAAAAVVAVALAVALSPFTPVGSSRAHEWDGGVRIDGVALAVGIAVIVVLLTGASMIASARAARRAEVVPGVPSTSDTGDRPSRAVELAAGAGASPAFVIGMRMALQPGRGRTAAPVRSVMTSIALAVALVVATAAFAADLDRLVSTPRSYGVGWDAAVGTSFGRIPDDAMDQLAGMPYVEAVSGAALSGIKVDGATVPAWGIDLYEGTVFPTLERGRLPQSESEIVLGRTTSEDLGLAVGEEATVTTPTGPHTMTVVGVATFPQLGVDRFSETSLGTGAATVASVMGPGDGFGRYNYGLVRFPEGVDRQQTVEQLRADVAALGCPDQTCVLTDLRPRELDAYAGLRGIWGPALLALGALLAMTLVHGLVTSVRARRHDLAILGALGLSEPQTRRAVTWEALTLAGCALLIGIPVGLAGASLAWLAFARSIGVSPGAAVAGWALAVIAGSVLVVAALIGAACSSEAIRGRRTPALAT